MNTVDRYIKIWEAEETAALTADRDRRLAFENQDQEALREAEAELQTAMTTEIDEYAWDEKAADGIYFKKNIPEEER